MEVAVSREPSQPAATPPAHPTHHGHPSRKRKHAAIAHAAAASPAPSDPGATPAPENVVLSAKHDLASRPRLTISRHPVFVPVVPGSPYHTTDPLCFNRLGYRYTPAGISPVPTASVFRTIESNPTSYRVSWEDRSPFVRVTQDGLGLLGEKGFRSARCNAPVREGRWYLEVTVENGAGASTSAGTGTGPATRGGASRREGPHVRMGWARREAPLNAPAGYDGYSYAVRDKTGEKVHLSRPRPYGQPFGTGDVVGMYICLPPRRKGDPRDAHDPAHVKRERIAIEFKGQEYYESLEYAQSKEMIALMDASDRAKATDTKSLPSSSAKKSATVKNVTSTGRGKGGAATQEDAAMRPVPTLGSDSYVAFFVNGACQGIAFQDLYDYRPLRKPPGKSASKPKAPARDGIKEHKENPFDDGTLGYYPFVSLFNGAQVRINPGPDFQFAPPPDIDTVIANPGADIKPQPDAPRKWRPVCERYKEFMDEQWALDVVEEEEAQKALAALAAQDDGTDKSKQEKSEQHRQAKRKPHGTTKGHRRTKPAHDGDGGPHKRAKTALSTSTSTPAPEPEPQRPPQRRPAAAHARMPAIGTFTRGESRAGSRARTGTPAAAPTPTPGPETREGSERAVSPASSLDAQIAGLAGYHDHDASAYNTDYDDIAADVDTDGDAMDIVGEGEGEMDPIEEAVAYSYGVRH